MQGFQLLHSLGGGTGAGLGSLLISKLREVRQLCVDSESINSRLANVAGVPGQNAFHLLDFSIAQGQFVHWLLCRVVTYLHQVSETVVEVRH